MWEYKKHLEFPVSVSKKNLGFAKEVITAIGGPAG